MIITWLVSFMSQQVAGATASSSAAMNGSVEDYLQPVDEDSFFHKYFRRGTANIQWCEDVVAKYSHSEWVAEYYNTWSNLAFCFVALWGMKRCYEQSLGSAFWAAEIVMLVGVGFGSMLFHAHQSKAAQCADEIPMSVLLIVQLHCLEGVHPWLTPSVKGVRATLLYWNHGMVALFWLVYGYTNIFGVFETGFTLQVISSLGLLFDAGRRFEHPQRNWYGAVGFIVVAKVIWEIERKLYRDGACDTPGALSLHPLWHGLAALSHYCAMKQNAELLIVTRDSKSINNNDNNKLRDKVE